MTCLTCATEFAPRRRDHRFCSAKCRLRAFEAKREAKCQERDAHVRMVLLTALEAVQEARELLKGAAQKDTPE